MKFGVNKVLVLGCYLVVLVLCMCFYLVFYCIEMVMDNLMLSWYEKSLGLLIIKFVLLLQEVKDGVLDFKVVRCFLYQ